jgi:hypothetical protein
MKVGMRTKKGVNAEVEQKGISCVAGRKLVCYTSVNMSKTV